MPFLAPFAPAIAGGVGALIGGLRGKGRTERDIRGLTEQQREASEFALGEAKQTLGQAREALQGPLEFYQTLLGGDRAALTETLAPEIGTVVSQFDTARKNIAQFAPRGGGRTAQLAESQFDVADIITRLLTTARREAAGGIAGIAGQLGALGTGELGISTGSVANLLNTLVARRGQNIDVQTQLGTGIGRLISQIIGAFDKDK